MRLAARVDGNQVAIIAALRAAGASVAILSGVGGGVPDLLVGWRGANILLEIKNPTGRGNKLTPAESEFVESWRGQVAIVEDISSALALLGYIENL
jgi:hypothetical protein